MFSKVVIVSLAAALAGKASAQFAEVFNGLSQTIFFELVNAGGVIDTSSIEPGTGHEIDLGPQVSMKMDLDGSFSSPYQFEFNYDSSTGITFYDFSAVDGDPFSNVERSITPTDPSCTPIDCPAGDVSNDCQFTTPTDFNPLSCPTSANNNQATFNVVIGGAPISKRAKLVKSAKFVA